MANDKNEIIDHLSSFWSSINSWNEKKKSVEISKITLGIRSREAKSNRDIVKRYIRD